MSNPLALLPLALAAAGGRIDGLATAQLVAAGLTLLQRGAPLVRALAGKRSALLLPASPAVLVALAASDGRGALLLDPAATPSDIARHVHAANVGAVFTVASFSTQCPVGVPIVWLDHAPWSARMDVQGISRTVDLGSHFGLHLEGETAVAGRDEECVAIGTAGAIGDVTTFSHRALLDEARRALERRPKEPGQPDRRATVWASVPLLLEECVVPLLHGDEVHTAWSSPLNATSPAN